MRGRGLPRGVVLLLIVAVTLVVASIARRVLVPPDPAEQLRDVRDELRVLRLAADSCSAAVQEEESRFRAFDDHLDSLRSRVDALEALDPRGVPADSYEIYINTFHTYNDGVPGWEEAADSLEVHWESCRALVDRHNRMADSARDLARELELLPEGREPARR